MTSTISPRQQTIAAATLTTLEHTLTTVITHPDTPQATRNRLTKILATTGDKRQHLTTISQPTATRWTREALRRTTTLHRIYHHAFTPAPISPPQPSQEHHRCTPTTQEHRRLLTELTELLQKRKSILRKATRATTGALHTAITEELNTVTGDLATMATKSFLETKTCVGYHTRADQLWRKHGAEALLLPDDT